MKKDISEYSRDELEYAIDQYVICFRNCERNRLILKRAMFDGIPHERIAEEFGLTPRRVNDIIHSTQEKLYKHL